MTITTDTHEIRAYYSIDGGIVTHEITKNGYTVEEIIDEMIRFLDWMPGLATPFEVTNNTTTEDGFKVTIEGEGFRFNKDGDETDEKDRMIVVIEGVEK